MVGIATSGINRPRFPVTIVVVGHERLGVLSLASSATEGGVLFNQLISPELIGARLKGFSKLYDRYYFQRMTFKYVPLIPPGYRDWETDRKSTRLNSSHEIPSRMPSSA